MGSHSISLLKVAGALVLLASPAHPEMGLAWKRPELKGRFDDPDGRQAQPQDSLDAINGALYVASPFPEGPWRMDPGGVWRRAPFAMQLSGVVGTGTLSTGPSGAPLTVRPGSWSGVSPST